MGFTVAVKRTFSASHMIPGYPGPCARLHGHNWTVEAAFRTEGLNALGMAVDFHEIERWLDPVVAEVDHSHLNDHPFFGTRTTTAENIALFFFRRLSAQIDSDPAGVSLAQVSIWEMDGYRSTYGESS